MVTCYLQTHYTQYKKLFNIQYSKANTKAKANVYITQAYAVGIDHDKWKGFLFRCEAFAMVKKSKIQTNRGQSTQLGSECVVITAVKCVLQKECAEEK